MSAVLTDVVEHIYFCLLVLFKAMWRMLIMSHEGLLFLTFS